MRRTALSTRPPQAGDANAAVSAFPTRGWLDSAAPAFATLFSALWLLHLPLLRLPYFWDEAGYFIPAARDLLLTGDLIPHTTLSNAHPPLVMIWLALCWKLAGYSPLGYCPMVTRMAMLLVAAFGFTALWLLARRVAGQAAAIATVLLTALTPTIFVQSAMAHLDIAAFALVLWMLYAYLCGRRWPAIVFAALAAVAKETTVAVTLTLCAYEILGCFARLWWPTFAGSWHMWGREATPLRQEQTAPLKHTKLEWGTLFRPFAWLLALLPLVGWYAYHFHRTGHVLGNPDYLRYNVGATVRPVRILIALWMRLWHAVGYMNLFVLTASALLFWWSARKSGDESEGGIPRNIQFLFAFVVLAQVAEFSVVGGALLARYMIPALPLVILVSVDVLRRHAPQWQVWIGASAAAFVVALFFNPPWYIAPEDNLTWTHFARLHQRAAHYAEQHYAGDRILTAWPASDELNRPFLGYVQQPLTVVSVENFTAEEMLPAHQQEESFDVVLAFSTKFEPRRAWISHIPFIAKWTRAQTRYFDFHQDLPPATIARLLQGQIVWQESAPGEWIALIELNKARNARLMR